MFILTVMTLQYSVHPFLSRVKGSGREDLPVFTMLLHGPVRSDPTNNIHRTEEIIPAVLRQPPVRLIVFYQEEPVGEICLIKRSDAKSDINHGKVKTPAL